MRKKGNYWWLFSLALVLLAACKPIKQNKTGLEVVATMYPVYEVTQEIVGQEGEVSLLIPAGTEVHDFEPSPRDISQIEESDALVYVSPEMETWVSRLKKSTDSQIPVIQATKGMVLLPASEEDHHHDGAEHHHTYDPHVWTSPYRMIQMVESVRDQLVKEFPDKKEIFMANARAYLKQLRSLDQEYREAFDHSKRRIFVTQHGAFAYLALDYGLRQVSVTGVAGEQEPSAKKLAQLSDFLKRYQIPYLFRVENMSPAIARTLSDETGVEVKLLHPLESLTKKQQEDGESYVTLMRENLKYLKEATEKDGPEIPQEAQLRTIENGYFSDEAVQDRTLSDYAGDWQSVYPMLQDGYLDQVMDIKAKKNKDRTADEYKSYYQTGYETSIDHLIITGRAITFISGQQKKTFTYDYKGYQILQYKAGNRGVRYLFEAKEEDAGPYRYVQFSDHQITHQEAHHFHLYIGGDSQEALLEEMEHWPTYYPSEQSAAEIAQEMVAH